MIVGDELALKIMMQPQYKQDLLRQQQEWPQKQR
jgi:hypothetical protein